MNKPFVSSIQPGEVCIINATSELKTKIKKNGFHIRCASRSGHRWKGTEHILFEPHDESIFNYGGTVPASPILINICLFLKSEGIPFRANFKMDFSPSDFMRQLQKEKAYDDSFFEISWDSGDCVIAEIKSAT